MKEYTLTKAYNDFWTCQVIEDSVITQLPYFSGLIKPAIIIWSNPKEALEDLLHLDHDIIINPTYQESFDTHIDIHPNNPKYFRNSKIYELLVLKGWWFTDEEYIKFIKLAVESEDFPKALCYLWLYASKYSSEKYEGLIKFFDPNTCKVLINLIDNLNLNDFKPTRNELLLELL